MKRKSTRPQPTTLQLKIPGYLNQLLTDYLKYLREDAIKNGMSEQGQKRLTRQQYILDLVQAEIETSRGFRRWQQKQNTLKKE